LDNDTVSVLIVDDEETVRASVSAILESEGYAVLTARTGIEMSNILANQRVDLILLDLMLGKEDGFALARDLRAASDVPIVILSGLDEIIDRVVGLEIGADDYITKPFHVREFKARIKTVLRRYAIGGAGMVGNFNSAPANIVEFNGWRFNLESGELTDQDETDVALTTYEFQVLSVFAKNSKRVLSRSRILDSIFHRDWEPYDRSVDVLIGKLRKKLKDDPRQPKLIRTMRNIGYMFVAEVSNSKKRAGSSEIWPVSNLSDSFGGNQKKAANR
jgi:two-component system, OmpR family, response regulator